MDYQSNIGNPAADAAIIACLVQRLGGKVVLSQAEFDAVAGAKLDENCDGKALSLEISSPTSSTVPQ